MKRDCQSSDCDGCNLYLSDHACLNRSNSQAKERKMEKAIEFFEIVELTSKVHPHGLLVDGRFIFSPSTGKWRNSTKAVWYKSKGPADFYLRFIAPSLSKVREARRIRNEKQLSSGLDPE